MPLKHYMRSFWADDDASMSVELVLVTPILVWVLLSTWVYFDAFQAEAHIVRAGNVVADMYSREEDEITDGFINASFAVFQLMTRKMDTHDMRVTAIQYDEDDDEHEVVWSQVRGAGNYDVLVTGTIDTIRERIPTMHDGSQILLVETGGVHRPVFTIGLGFAASSLSDVQFERSFPTGMRFVSRICYNPTPLLGATTAICDPI